MRDLVAGERADLGGEVVVAFGDSAPPLALIALDAARTAASAFPPIDTATREMRPAATFAEDGGLTLRLDQMPAAVDRLLLVAFDPDAQPLRRTLKADLGAMRFAVDLSARADAAVILLEFYRHRGAWRLAANGQGFSGGLIAIAATHGVDPDWARRLGHRGVSGFWGERSDDASDYDRRPPPRGGDASGSGVAVDRHHVLSNAHVVDEAGRITVVAAGRPIVADLVFSDARNDLALLRVDAVLPSIAAFRPGLDLHLGEDIVVLGFPLKGLLGTGPQASAGNIAGLCGVGNDSSVFQFTAPIASGNSGGPVVDTAGNVIGLVSSSLNLDRVRQSGANAENINFAIKGAIIRSFLDAFGLQPFLSDRTDPLGRAVVVRQMRDAIFRIDCSC